MPQPKRSTAARNPKTASLLERINYLVDHGWLQEAAPLLRGLAQAGPADPEAEKLLKIHALSEEEFPQAWAVHLESGTEEPDRHQRKLVYRPWDGQRLAEDQTLFVWSARGEVSAEIRFASLLLDVEKFAARTVVECDYRLLTLFRRSFPQLSFMKRSESPAPLGEDKSVAEASYDRLGKALRNTRDEFPLHSGYLVPDEKLTQEARTRYASFEEPLTVGISWFSADFRKDCPLLLDWSPLLETPGIRFVNVQYHSVKPEIEELERFSSGRLFTDGSLDAFDDLEGLAARLSSLDLVICISNRTLHLAGALGVPVWAILDSPPVHTSLPLAGEQTAWYPSVRLFRREREKSWYNLMARMSFQLQRLRDAKKKTAGKTPDG